MLSIHTSVSYKTHSALLVCWKQYQSLPISTFFWPLQMLKHITTPSNWQHAGTEVFHDIPLQLQLKYLELAQFVLKKQPYQMRQVIGSFPTKKVTAKGTSFIMLIWDETPRIDVLCKHITVQGIHKLYFADLVSFFSWAIQFMCKVLNGKNQHQAQMA